MKRLSRSEFDALMRDTRALSSDCSGPKVLRAPDGTIVKLFRRRKLLSSGLIWPPALRFERASRRLQSLGVASVIVDGAYRIPEIGRHAVVYREIPGETLRELVASPEARGGLLVRLAELLADLHAKGVYFRALHFGNLICGPGGRLSLIDISEVRVKRRRLGPGRRARNFKPLTAYPQDAAALEAFGPQSFLDHYLKKAALGKSEESRFLDALRRRSSPWTGTPRAP